MQLQYIFKKRRKRRSLVDWIFDIFLYIILSLLVVVTLYPLLNSLAISLNEASDTMRGGITIWPRKFTLENYAIIMKNAELFRAMLLTAVRTLVGASTSVLATAMMAYGLSKSHLKGRRFYTTFCLITMYFSGGLIPTYMVIKALGLTNSFAVYIIPNLVSVWNMIIMRTYFKSQPEALEESARIDGASTLAVFFRIVLPVSLPIVATIALFNGVFHWNSWFDAAIYTTDANLRPLQLVLNSLINSSRFAQEIANAGAAAAMLKRQNVINPRSITMATMIVSIIPIVMVYPFLQKYFANGMMIGAIKD